MSIFNKDHNSKAAYAIMSCLEGSWLIDALYNITDEQKALLVGQFTDQYGQVALAEAIHHVESDYSLSTVPEFMARRFK